MKDTVLGFNRELAKELGVTAALLYQELQRKFFYWQSQGKLNDEGMFWCDQGEIADWILVHPNTVSKAAKDLEDAGLIKKKVSYRPGTVTPTTWWGLLNTESTPNVDTGNHNNCENHIKANTKADTTAESTFVGDPVIVFLRVNPSGKAWKSQRVYSTQEEVDRLEESDPDETIDFKYWKSPKMVGDDARAKFKRTKAKLIQPDVKEEPDEVNQIEGLEHYMKFGDM